MKHISPETPPLERKMVGKIGEDIACRYLKERGYRIINRNYSKKWGEIDVICEKEGKLTFVEVKTVTHEINSSADLGYRAEENMHPWKIKRLSRTIQSYLAEKYRVNEPNWALMGLTVLLDVDKKTAKVEILRDLVL
ncbi:MAG: hypothetical protein A2928_03670 [Candidatus Taylorbacteria bacterium RIFCSPLOWO2_01_FULL_45_15b]|uniref:UPF0102 protein A2928_03670 n=1 Tax=Candidatus Taylorbacteria bacterium RIFCSPLOWO2_01_FULL_45_15b TaxID=1802319 RepID=A0A1G2NF54_9BACT|nr:MAG: hypothetical protein A2928_03670 [Candidatus Taylorbacteria bacterium RIFCSPLOWO2_01_FULL_45_15b]